MKQVTANLILIFMAIIIISVYITLLEVVLWRYFRLDDFEAAIIMVPITFAWLFPTLWAFDNNTILKGKENG